MKRLLILAVVACGLGADAKKADEPVFVDLKSKTNQKVTDDFHSGVAGNSLEALPVGVQTLAGMKFKLGGGVIQLGSKVMTDRPSKVDGIPVNRAFATLRILHGTGYGGYKESPETSVEDGTEIGAYVVHYANGTEARVPIVYGKDVRDWWDWDDQPTPRAKLAWKGSNAAAKQSERSIRLYAVTWKNPHPGRTVTAIDFESNGKTAAAPFLVALTLEGK
jgi:hypothetical protein